MIYIVLSLVNDVDLQHRLYRALSFIEHGEGIFAMHFIVEHYSNDASGRYLEMDAILNYPSK